MSVYSQAFAPYREAVADWITAVGGQIVALSPLQGLVICAGVFAFAVYLGARPPRAYKKGPFLWRPGFGLGVVFMGLLVFSGVLAFTAFAPEITLAAEVATDWGREALQRTQADLAAVADALWLAIARLSAA